MHITPNKNYDTFLQIVCRFCFGYISLQTEYGMTIFFIFRSLFHNA